MGQGTAEAKVPQCLTSSILLLNASYEPLAVVTSKHALLMLLDGKIENVTDEIIEIHSPSQTFKLAYVVRLKTYVNVRYRITEYPSKSAILSRDGKRCCYCNRGAKTVDHIIPKSRGGEDRWDNLVAACYRCNQIKGNKTLQELGWKLRKQPERPNIVDFIVGNRRHISWQPYIGEMANEHNN